MSVSLNQTEFQYVALTLLRPQYKRMRMRRMPSDRASEGSHRASDAFDCSHAAMVAYARMRHVPCISPKFTCSAADAGGGGGVVVKGVGGEGGGGGLRVRGCIEAGPNARICAQGGLQRCGGEGVQAHATHVTDAATDATSPNRLSRGEGEAWERGGGGGGREESWQHVEAPAKGGWLGGPWTMIPNMRMPRMISGNLASQPSTMHLPII
jgi:hypothetical protein